MNATLLLWMPQFPQNVIRSLIAICPRGNNLLSASYIPGLTESFRPGTGQNVILFFHCKTTKLFIYLLSINSPFSGRMIEAEQLTSL